VNIQKGTAVLDEKSTVLYLAKKGMNTTAKHSDLSDTFERAAVSYIPVTYRVSRAKRSIFSAEPNYTKQISSFESLFKGVPITCDHTFAP
jgi:hypothetical protein